MRALQYVYVRARCAFIWVTWEAFEWTGVGSFPEDITSPPCLYTATTASCPQHLGAETFLLLSLFLVLPVFGLSLLRSRPPGGRTRKLKFTPSLAPRDKKKDSILISAEYLCRIGRGTAGAKRTASIGSSRTSQDWARFSTLRMFSSAAEEL